MSRAWKRRLAGLGVACVSLAVAACVGFSGYGDDYGDGAPGYPGYVGGYYEPWGYDYGGWGDQYWVGPPRGEDGWHRDGGYHDDHGRGRPMGDAGGRPRGGRAAPSIPRRPRG